MGNGIVLLLSGRISYDLFRSGTDLLSPPILLFLFGQLLQKAAASVVSNGIGMKFGRNVPRANTHRLTQSIDLTSHFQDGGHAITSFQAEECCHLGNENEVFPRAYAAAYASPWSIVHFVFFNVTKIAYINNVVHQWRLEEPIQLNVISFNNILQQHNWSKSVSK